MNTEKRLLLALALSFIVLAVWSNFAVKPKEKESFNQQNNVQNPAISDKIEQKSFVSPTQALVPSAFFEFPQGKRKIIFAEPQGAIKEINFSEYQSYTFPLKNCLQVGVNELAFNRQVIDNNRVTYTYSDNEKKIVKSFVFSDSNYDFEFSLIIENFTQSVLNLRLPIVLGTINPSLATANKVPFHDVTVFDAGKPLHPNFQKPATFPQLSYLALRDNYFCAIIEPEKAESAGFITKSSAKESEIGLFTSELKIVPRGTWEQKFRVYVGPQDVKILKEINPDWQSVIYFGKLDLIAQGLLMLLDVYYRFVHNWGWVIILLSISIYLILYPLTAQQMKSMKEMQALQPKIEELRKLYKDNSQRLNKEILELYRGHKVNPFGGCLPMVMQIPIFFALYQVLSRSIALKGASFLWIKDLSLPDALFLFPANFPLIGDKAFNILPILMSIEMFVQQKFSMVNVSSSQAEQQKIMLIVMPIMFAFLFYGMPSGLVLYWFINSTLTMLYQLRIAKFK